jgi:transcriptional regulator with XRE-family HTH domain
MHKTDRAELFRNRLAARLALTGMSRSALARAAGVDRSTIAQLLAGDEVRLPNAHLAAECARRWG